VAFVALDVKTVPARYSEISGRQGIAALVAESAETIIRSGVEHEFRTTVYPGSVELEELARIARALRGGRLYVLQQFRPGHTLDPKASRVQPFTADSLRAAARECSAHLPTVVRGLNAGQAA
jgi:pyruvate formate lyase activating enzyme